jgi:hypothetical protein
VEFEAEAWPKLEKAELKRGARGLAMRPAKAAMDHLGRPVILWPRHSGGQQMTPQYVGKFYSARGCSCFTFAGAHAGHERRQIGS